MTPLPDVGFVRDGEGELARCGRIGLSHRGIVAAMAADVAITGATVRTMDPERPVSDAVAVADGRIEAVGDDAVRQAVGPSTELLHLPGRLVVAGFQDAHVHPPSSGLERLRCDLNAIEDRQGYRDAIATYARTHPDAGWILGGGWSMAAFPGGTPRREDIDDVVPDRPAFLPNRDGHGAWVNSRALELAGIDSATRDPPDGRIEREADGSPSGTLHEGAMDLVETLIPEPDARAWEAAILEAQRYLHSVGITAWQDATVEAATLKAYRDLDDRGLLTARVVAALLWDHHRSDDQIEDLLELRRWGEGGRIRASTVKIFLDGVVENFTASMLDPYLDTGGNPTANQGLRLAEPEDLARIAIALDRRGFQLHFHAIGDRAVRDGLDAVEAVRKANGIDDRRPHIAHLQVVDRGDVPRFARLGVVANMQPVWACHEPQMDELTIPFLGPERARHQYPFGSLLRAGARLAVGSDWSVTTADPFPQMEVAVTRVDPAHRGNRAFLPEERLELDDVLRAFTTGSAYVNRLDGETGVIAPGRLADLVVVDRDITASDAGPLGDARALVTMVQGRVVHEDPALARG